ncbi:MAG TPA: transporter substrate-binding domain-containing protein, partial [Alphaproteobacteria bacterium]|nr:transporter substrate-binding domain-containing protein [Alphaproteobacteria bacterium]
AQDIVKLEDLKGKKLAVNKGSAYDAWAEQNKAKYGFESSAFPTQTDAVQAVLAGRADANLAGNTVVAWAAKQNPQLKLSYTISTGLVWSIPFRKDDKATRMQVENVVECMKRDGTFAQLHEKWFGVKAAPGSAAVTVYPGYGVPGMDGYDPAEHTPKCN